jgi:chromate transport protein ChrA
MHRYIKGMAISFIGVAGTILAYASGEGWHFDRRIAGWASATGLIAFILVSVLARRSRLSLTQGVFAGYGPVAVVVVLLVWNSLQDAESRMWLPVVVVVAAIYGFPIAFAASVGGRLAGLSKNEKSAEQAAP